MLRNCGSPSLGEPREKSSPGLARATTKAAAELARDSVDSTRIKAFRESNIPSLVPHQVCRSDLILAAVANPFGHPANPLYYPSPASPPHNAVFILFRCC